MDIFYAAAQRTPSIIPPAFCFIPGSDYPVQHKIKSPAASGLSPSSINSHT